MVSVLQRFVVWISFFLSFSSLSLAKDQIDPEKAVNSVEDKTARENAERETARKAKEEKEAKKPQGPEIPPAPGGRFRLMGKFGIVYNTGFGGGIEGNYAFTDNLSLGFDFIYGSGSITGEEDDVYNSSLMTRKREMTYRVTEVGLKLRWFLSNGSAPGLFLLGGLSGDQMAGETGYRIESNSLFSRLDKFYSRDYDATAVLAQFGIGYVYTFRFGLFLGGDFMTISYPIYRTMNVHGDKDELDSEYISAKMRDNLADDSAKKMTAIFAIKSLVTIGYRF